MRRELRGASIALVSLLLLAAACRGRGVAEQSGRDLVISRVMVDPTALSDERGEWIEITNVGITAADLRGWSLRSANDAGFVVRQSLVVPSDSSVILARSDALPEAGARARLVYSSIALSNSADWLALHDPRGATRDSVAWFAAPRGVPIDRRPSLSRATAPASGVAPSGAQPGGVAPRAPASSRELVVRVLDVGQGDAILIQNGGSTVLIDGGPERRALGRWLDQLVVRDTIDAVILSHAHSDHFEGLRELFDTRRRLTIRAFYSNGDTSTLGDYALFTDSVAARARSGRMIQRDTDDPCANGGAMCTLTLKGGALLHILRPMPRASLENNRSVAIKLVGPDSASFTMWIAGDAEHAAIRQFEKAGYAVNPGMRVDVLKADHHGSCNGVTPRYLELTQPEWVVASLGAQNDYGHMHEQAKAEYRAAGIPWYRTDQNGTVTIRSAGVAGSGYTITPSRPGKDLNGPSDRRASARGCAGSAG
jgi:competence protein ComEC